MSDASMSANLAGGTAAAGFAALFESQVYSVAFSLIALAFLYLTVKSMRDRRAAE